MATGHPFAAVRLGVAPNQAKRLEYGACAFGSRRPAAVTVDPNVAFNSLFGSVGSVMLGKPSSTDLLFWTSLAGMSNELWPNLVVPVQSAPWRLIWNLSRRSANVKSDSVRQRIGSGVSCPVEPGFQITLHPLERLEAQFELATAALLGELTPVVVLTSGVGDFNFTYSRASSRPIPTFEDWSTVTQSVTRLEVMRPTSG